MTKKMKMNKVPLGVMLRDFASAMMRSAREGFPIVPKYVYLSRRHRCNRCTTRATCPVCNCVLKVKCSMSTEKCPIDHWHPYEKEKETPKEYDLKVREKEELNK